MADAGNLVGDNAAPSNNVGVDASTVAATPATQGATEVAAAEATQQPTGNLLEGSTTPEAQQSDSLVTGSTDGMYTFTSASSDITISPEDNVALNTMAAQMGVQPQALQQAVDFAVSKMSNLLGDIKKYGEDSKKMIAAWQDESFHDPELNRNIGDIRKFAQSNMDKQLLKELVDSGMAYNPRFGRFLLQMSRIGKEGTFVSGSSSASGSYAPNSIESLARQIYAGKM